MNVAAYIDHTILKASTVSADIEKLCSEALEYQFAAVCVPPQFVKLSRNRVRGKETRVATVIGFPLGYSAAKAKFAEVEQAIEDGADELDIVINISSLKGGGWDYLEAEMKPLLNTIHANTKVAKVIIESGILSDNEIIRCCQLYSELGADYVKTSTGYAETGATLAAVQLMRANLPSRIRIKASGGVRTYAAAKQFIEAGADRIGSSSGVTIVKEQWECQ